MNAVRLIERLCFAHRVGVLVALQHGARRVHVQTHRRGALEQQRMVARVPPVGGVGTEERELQVALEAATLQSGPTQIRRAGRLAALFQAARRCS